MTKLFDIEQLAHLATLEKGAEINVEQDLLSDFTKTLEAVLEKQLRAEDYTVFLTNPTTGKTAASVSHVLRVMAFGQVNNWTHAVKNKVKALEENKAFEHHHPE